MIDAVTTRRRISDRCDELGRRELKRRIDSHYYYTLVPRAICYSTYRFSGAKSFDRVGNAQQRATGSLAPPPRFITEMEDLEHLVYLFLESGHVCWHDQR